MPSQLSSKQMSSHQSTHLWEPPVVVEHDHCSYECFAGACWEAHQAVAADQAPGGLELIFTQRAVGVYPRPASSGAHAQHELEQIGNAWTTSAPRSLTGLHRPADVITAPSLLLALP